MVGLHGHEVHAVEFGADVAPGVAAGVLHDPDRQQPEPAELDAAADPVLSVVEDRPESDRSLQVSPTPFDLQELLVGEGEISGREAVVTGLQEPLAVQLGLSGDGRLVDAEAEAAVLQPTDQAPESGSGAEPPGEFVAS